MCFWGALTWWLSGFVINVSLQSSSSLSPIAQSLALRIQSFVLRVLAVANEYGTNLHSVETAEDVAFLRPFQQKTNAVLCRKGHTHSQSPLGVWQVASYTGKTQKTMERRKGGRERSREEERKVGGREGGKGREEA